ncbi:MAG: response regulator transcription factor [Actinomycetota bacterium]
MIENKPLPSRAPDAAYSGVRSLVQELVHQVTGDGGSAAAPKLDEAEPGVILDLEVDDVRCLLVRSSPNALRVRDILSPREQEIARMVAKGYTNKAIAGVLDISSWTVCTHLRRVFGKLNVCSRAAMVARLMERDEVIDPTRRFSSDSSAR